MTYYIDYFDTNGVFKTWRDIPYAKLPGTVEAIRLEGGTVCQVLQQR